MDDFADVLEPHFVNTRAEAFRCGNVWAQTTRT
jgi:hypothetical protein